MKKFKILPLVLIMLLSLSLLPTPALALTDPEIGATAAVVMNRESGEIYYEKNADRRIQPASTTKLVTALLVAEAVEAGKISLSDNITAGETCLYNLEPDSSDSSPRLVPGEVMNVEDLLYCTMLASANEACNLLAQYVGGSIDSFVDSMNARVEELGCTGTHFANANGLEQENHYSTARDFALIAQEAMKHPLIQEVVGTLRHTVAATNVAEARDLVNTNNLLDPDTDFYYAYAYGIKTGFFTNAGYCLVSGAAKDNIDVICVVMGGREINDQFRDTLTLYDWVFENYQYRQILGSTETVVTVPVRMGSEESVGVRAEDTVSVILPADYDTSRIGYQYVLYHEAEGEKLDAPVNAGQVLGEITVVEMDEENQAIRTFGTSRLVAASSVDMSRREYISSQISDLFQAPVVRRIITILIVLLAIYVLLMAFYFIQRIRHLRSLRQAKRERAIRQTDEEAQWLKLPHVKNVEPSIEYFSASEEPVPVLEEPEEAPEKADDAAEEEVEAAKPVEVPKPRRRMPRNELTDEDFFDSFFKS